MSSSALRSLKNSKVIVLKTPKDYKHFESSNERCVIFYSAKVCPSCINILDFYIRIANKYHHKVSMAYVDVTDSGLDFSTIPVFTGIYKGEEIHSFVGADKLQLKKLVKKVILSK